MNPKKRNLFIKISAIAIIVFVLAYLSPIIVRLLSINLGLFLDDQDGLNQSWQRTLLFALVSTVFTITSALFLAIGLRKWTLLSKQGKYLAFLLVPVLLGNVSVAFVGKLLFAQNPFFHQNEWIKFGTLLLIQFWQFGLMYVYLFWLVIQGIPQKTWEYAQTARLRYGELVKDIILPACKNLAMLLFILNFIFSIYEEAKIQFIFKASRGTNTELISQWLGRHYQSLSLLNVNAAIQSTLQVSLIMLVLALLSILLVTFLFNALFVQATVKRYRFPFFQQRWIATVYGLLLAIFVFFPIILVLGQSYQGFQSNLSHLFLPMGFTALAAFLASTVSVFLGIFLRLGWPDTLSSFNNKSLFFFVFLFFLQLLPPISLLITGFQWLRIIGYQSNLYLVWILGHLVLILPLLSSFLTVTHFRTSNKELDYLQAYQLRLSEILSISFVRRFGADYLLTFLLAFSLIWNEAIINNLLSDFIPSFVSEMKMSITGRSTDYAKGMTYLLVSLSIAFLALVVWKLILDRVNIDKAEVTE